MLASWVQQGTSTTGTGTITLDGTPADGFQAFSNAFSSGDIVHYTIEDGNNRETGVGTLTSGTDWTLSRDQIIEKLDTGTYSRFPATGLSLSGSAVVSCSASSANVLDGIECGNSTGTAEFAPENVLGSTGNAGLVDNLAWIPIKFSTPVHITAMGAKIDTADAAATMLVGIYSSVDKLPKTLLAEVSLDTSSTGVTMATVSGGLDLTPGWYWWATWTDSSTLKFDGISSLKSVFTAFNTVSGLGHFPRAAYPTSSLTNLPTTASIDSYDSTTSRHALPLLRV